MTELQGTSMKVVETFFSIEVDEMERAVAFYVDALGATVSYATPRWTSLHAAHVRIGLFANPGHARGIIGLHFVVDDLDEACRAVERAGGTIATPAREVAPSVVVADATDTEGNTFAMRQQ